MNHHFEQHKLKLPVIVEPCCNKHTIYKLAHVQIFRNHHHHNHRRKETRIESMRILEVCI